MSEISRRHFVEGTGAGIVAAKVVPSLKAQPGAAEQKGAGNRITPELAAQAGQAAIEGARPLAKSGYEVKITATIVKRSFASVGSA